MAFTQDQRVSAANCVAQMFALRSWSPGDPQLRQDIIELFDTFLMLIAGTAFELQLSPGPVSKQGDKSGKTTRPVITPGGAVQLHDNQQFPLVVSAIDTKGFPVQDTSAVTFTVDDSTVLSLTEQPDGSWLAVAGQPGSAVITGSDGNITGTLAVDVTPGDVAALEITAGTVTDQPTSNPTTGPTTGPATGPTP